MPTRLPTRHSDEHRKLDAEGRALMLASVLLLATLTLACHKFLPPLAGYSLAASAAELQLSP
jgi:hypothetical protein